MLYPDMQPMDKIPSGGGATKPKPSSYLPTYITVYVNTPNPPSLEWPIPNDTDAVVAPAPSDPSADVDRQARPDARRHRATEDQAQSIPDYMPDLEADNETAGVNLGNVTSHEDLFLSMDAVDLSYYFSVQEYDLVREVATCLRHEKLIHFFLDNPRECLKLFATYTWDEEADAAAEEFIQWYVDRFRTELEEQRDIARSGPAFGAAEDSIERWHKDLTNDENEVVIAIDLRTGETLFVRYGDEDSVTLQDAQKELVEDRYIALLHHHPSRGAASLADLDAAKWLKAELLLVSNQDGTLHRYARVGEMMIPLEPTRNPEYAAAVNPLETAAADAAYLAQTLLELGNPPEMVMRQEETVPSASDYVTKPMFRVIVGPPINQDFARPWGTSDFSPLSPLISWYIGNSAESAQSHGLDNAGKMLLHWVGGSGERVAVNVDEMINDILGFGPHIMDTVGFDLGKSPPLTGNTEDRHNETVAFQSDRYLVSVYDLDWKQVGKGIECPDDDIYGCS